MQVRPYLSIIKFNEVFIHRLYSINDNILFKQYIVSVLTLER
jgi:hypothetical protein